MVTKKEVKESCTNESCKCGGCCGGKILTCLLALAGCVAAVVACVYSIKNYNLNYDLNVLPQGGKVNVEKMNELYKTQAFIDYMTERADASIESFNAQFGGEQGENAADNGNSSLDNLKAIAVELGTNETELNACVEEWKYRDAVNEMMQQGNELFGVSGTPGNVIVDTTNGNYIVVSGAYPADEFVNAINEYKNGAENYVAWGEAVKTAVENMLKSAPINGKEGARFTIVEYTELLCPFCQRHSQAGTINSVIEQFPEEVNSVSRHFIIHGEEALQLAATMECVAELNPGAYYKTFEEAFKGL